MCVLALGSFTFGHGVNVVAAGSPGKEWFIWTCIVSMAYCSVMKGQANARRRQLGRQGIQCGRLAIAAPNALSKLLFSCTRYADLWLLLNRLSAAHVF